MLSPIHIGFNTYTLDSDKDKINMTLSLSNPLDYDVVINSIEYVKSEELVEGGVSNVILHKKETIILDIKLDRHKLDETYYYIHLKTTEGTIPIKIPSN